MERFINLNCHMKVTQNYYRAGYHSGCDPTLFPLLGIQDRNLKLSFLSNYVTKIKLL